MKEPDIHSLTTKYHSIRHTGTISNISGNTITVSLSDNINCSGCSSKSACGMAETASKQIVLPNQENSFNINETVELVLEKNMGLKAVIWAYIFPFILMLTSLFVSLAFFSEPVSGLIALLVLIPYYTMLYFSKNIFQRVFKLSVIKNKSA
ncbi:MAG: SoxR reducing system RseC family protein [Flavobacteriaceae bacterium]|nr:SoxR reducing system RseC family protein [Flavobacteriaceae bacterium]